MITQLYRSARTGVVDGIYHNAKEDTYFRLLITTLFVWGFVDTLSTYIAISAYGTVQYEWNPIMRFLLEQNVHLLTVSKTIGLLSVGLLAMYGRTHITAVFKWQLFFRLLIYTGIIVGVVNLYAAYTAVTGYDPVFQMISEVL